MSVPFHGKLFFFHFGNFGFVIDFFSFVLCGFLLLVFSVSSKSLLFWLFFLPSLSFRLEAFLRCLVLSAGIYVEWSKIRLGVLRT